jgi:hypothetical protein
MPAVPVKVKMDKATATNVIYLVAGLIGLTVTLFLFWKFRNKISEKIEQKNTSDRIIEQEKEDEAISQETGLPKAKISRARNVAVQVAKALGTHKNTPWYRKGYEDEILAINHLNTLEDEAEALIASEFYRTDATDGRGLRADLERLMFNYRLVQINLFDFIQ